MHTTDRLSRNITVVLLTLGLTLPRLSAAEEPGLPLLELGVGAAAYSNPSYPGSDVRANIAFPFPYLIYRGDWLRIDRSLQGILYETRRIKADLSASATAPVDSGDSDARDGMPDLDRTFHVGPALSLLLTDPALPDNLWSRLTLRSAVSVDTDDWNFKQRGWVLDGRLRYQRPLIGDLLNGSVEIGASVADRDYTGYFYNVPVVYATPERPDYRADAGYAGARLGLGLYGVKGRWRWSLYGAYLNLQGTAFADSPLLTSKHDFSLGATLGWMFWQSERRVVPKNSSPGGEFDTPLFGL